MLIEKEKSRSHKLKHNKINTNNKLKVIKKSLDKHGNTLHDNTKQWLAPTNLSLQTKTQGQ